MIYFLTHERVLEKDLIDKKYIGVFNTLNEVKKTKEKYLEYEGFRKFPEGFKIKKYNVNNGIENENFKNIYLLGYHKKYKDGTEDNEILGFFSSNKKAKEYLSRYKIENDLKSRARGFYTEKWKMNSNFRWEGGFITQEEYLDSIK